MPRYTDNQIEQALRECKGMVYVAAKRLGCSANTIKARLIKSPKLVEAIEESEGQFVDTAELKLYEQVMNGEAWAVQFALKTKGKNRGYAERQEIAGPNGESLTFTVKLDNADSGTGKEPDL